LNTIDKLVTQPWISILQVIEIILQIRHRHVRLTYAKIGQHFFRGNLHRFGKDVFLEHYARIRELVPADNLLEYHISEGWAPLCQFLGEPVPTLTFPSGNEVAGFRQKFQVRDRSISLEIVSKLLVFSVAAVLFTLLLFSDSKPNIWRDAVSTHEI
jgi:hypothetical protein